MKPIIAVPAIAALVYRAWSRNSLTTPGILVAFLTAVAHAYHPWNLPFVLLATFFLAGTRVTHVKESVKATLTLSSTGASGGEGPRNHIQVLANSLVASLLSLLHAHRPCSPASDILLIGLIANYASVAADTFSSELGILSPHPPRLITSLSLRPVPRGTNGGVTLLGLAAGLAGSSIIVLAALLILPACAFQGRSRLAGAVFVALWGLGGSLLDSVLGALLQRSVRDVRSGKIVEARGGGRVLVSAKEKDAKGSRVVESGWDVLDNNQVNFVMAASMSVAAMGVASWYLGVPVRDVLRL